MRKEKKILSGILFVALTASLVVLPGCMEQRNSMAGVAVHVNVTIGSYSGSGTPTVRLVAMDPNWGKWFHRYSDRRYSQEKSL